jgi:hypothetical protein
MAACERDKNALALVVERRQAEFHVRQCYYLTLGMRSGIFQLEFSLDQGIVA